MSKDPQGPMENLLEGLEHHTKFLSDTELKAELQERGVDIDDFLQSANATIASYDSGLHG